MRRLALATPAAVLALAASAFVVSTPARAATVVHVNAPADCRTDATSQLQELFESVGPNTTIQFAKGGCYLLQRGVVVKSTSGLILEGNGATLRRTQVSPPELRYPKANPFLEFDYTDHLTVRGLHIQGLNGADGQGAVWDQTQEFDAGIRLVGTRHVVISDMTIEGTYGDGVQTTVHGVVPGDVTIRNVTISRNGRQGISANAMDGLLIDHVNITWSRRSGIDLEPDLKDWVINNVEIRNSRIASNLLPFAADGQGTVNNVWIHDNTIPFSGIPVVSSRSGSDLPRIGWRVENNHGEYRLGSPQPAMRFKNTQVLIRNNVFQFAPKQPTAAVGLTGSSNAIISNNWWQDAKSPWVWTADSALWSGSGNVTGAYAPATLAQSSSGTQTAAPTPVATPSAPASTRTVIPRFSRPNATRPVLKRTTHRYLAP